MCGDESEASRTYSKADMNTLERVVRYEEKYKRLRD
jgi:hypothetical protein